MPFQRVVTGAAWNRPEALIATEPGPEPADLGGVGEPVRRYFEHAGVATTARAARIEMRGQIKLGRWLPFRSRQLLAPRLGTVWAARVAGVIVGSDRYVGGAGGMDWRIRMVPLVPPSGARWTARDESHIEVSLRRRWASATRSWLTIRCRSERETAVTRGPPLFDLCTGTDGVRAARGFRAMQPVAS